MLTFNQSEKFPQSGNLYLKIEFKNGNVNVLHCDFKESIITKCKDQDQEHEEFSSSLLAVTNGVDKWTFAIDALVRDLRTLAGSSPDEFFATLAPKVMGSKRNHIARNRADVYPLRPSLALQNTVCLVDGWYLGKNIANREKLKILRAACDLQGLRPVFSRKARRIN